MKSIPYYTITTCTKDRLYNARRKLVDWLVFSSARCKKSRKREPQKYMPNELCFTKSVCTTFTYTTHTILIHKFQVRVFPWYIVSRFNLLMVACSIIFEFSTFTFFLHSFDIPFKKNSRLHSRHDLDKLIMIGLRLTTGLWNIRHLMLEVRVFGLVWYVQPSSWTGISRE